MKGDRTDRVGFALAILFLLAVDAGIVALLIKGAQG